MPNYGAAETHRHQAMPNYGAAETVLICSL